MDCNKVKSAVAEISERNLSDENLARVGADERLAKEGIKSSKSDRPELKVKKVFPEISNMDCKAYMPAIAEIVEINLSDENLARFGADERFRAAWKATKMYSERLAKEDKKRCESGPSELNVKRVYPDKNLARFGADKRFRADLRSTKMHSESLAKEDKKRSESSPSSELKVKKVYREIPNMECKAYTPAIVEIVEINLSDENLARFGADERFRAAWKATKMHSERLAKEDKKRSESGPSELNVKKVYRDKNVARFGANKRFRADLRPTKMHSESLAKEDKKRSESSPPELKVKEVSRDISNMGCKSYTPAIAKIAERSLSDENHARVSDDERFMATWKARKMHSERLAKAKEQIESSKSDPSELKVKEVSSSLKDVDKAHLLTGKGGQNAPKGCQNLDPAATTQEPLPVKMFKEMDGVAKAEGQVESKSDLSAVLKVRKVSNSSEDGVAKWQVERSKSDLSAELKVRKVSSSSKDVVKARLMKGKGQNSPKAASTWLQQRLRKLFK